MGEADPLVSTAWLSRRLGLVRVVDASWHLPSAGRDARAEFEAGHLPGADFFDLDAISDQESSLPHMLPSPEQFGTAVGALGIGNSDCIVVYDSLGLFSAARAWWMFRVMGHEDVRVLDGGLPQWRSEGRPIERGPATAAPAKFDAALRPDLVRSLEQLKTAGGSDQVVDARPAPRFIGEAPEPRPGLRLGHMPGAVNLPFMTLMSEGRLRPSEELRRIFESAGVDPERPLTASCGSGVTAAVVLLALAGLGRWDGALYDGSWAEWGGRSDTPVTTGA